MRKLIKWIDDRFPLIDSWKKHVSEYYAPRNFNFFYFFGSLAILVLVNQLLTGLWLTMFYTPTSEQAFSSIEYIMRDVKGGWFLRYMHSTGASAFFIVIYLHMFRGVLYGSYQKPRELIWLIGMALFVLLMAEAFFGYLLPWGQMSYWGAQVITSLFGAIPFIGENLVTWLRGDFTVANATLQRFFALHVIGIPLLLVFLAYIHIIALHKVGSSNPEGTDLKHSFEVGEKPVDVIPFHPYYTIKDSVGVLVFLIIFFAIVFFAPEMGGYFLEYANFDPANPMVTPEHIAPVWYMTPFYSILRAIPDKLLGIIAMGTSILILVFVPWLDRSPVRSMRYKGIISRIALGIFVLSFVTLGVLGTKMVTPFTQTLARVCTIIYFAFFIFMPFYTRYEKYREPVQRIPQ